MHTILEANKYCLKPIHGIYGLNNCPQIEGIYLFFGGDKEVRNHTSIFTIGLVSFSRGLKFGLPPLKTVGLISSSFILDCFLFFFFHGTLSSMFFPPSEAKNNVGNEHAIRCLIAF